VKLLSFRILAFGPQAVGNMELAVTERPSTDVKAKSMANFMEKRLDGQIALLGLKLRSKQTSYLWSRTELLTMIRCSRMWGIDARRWQRYAAETTRLYVDMPMLLSENLAALWKKDMNRQ
jgi:hypothetical protein